MKVGRSTVLDYNNAKTKMEKSESDMMQAKYEVIFNCEILDFCTRKICKQLIDKALAIRLDIINYLIKARRYTSYLEIGMDNPAVHFQEGSMRGENRSIRMIWTVGIVQTGHRKS